ncbi:Large terminase phage packaging protein [Lutimaribacter pacificus]|uniref:Large terminase phage packaging protein n=1 Tax=Lutimaribacter pacificus TaxID=391948 RepID=A0A1H0AN41_9RHOB|nr:terminase family protein [Lutimaribacter pacificus]SDN34809.1 Large terminase phage packaging protein [Lutimaribacter pacificus]SHJ67112.1 Large terminase phage packaging protein [Lutimaribacter pacificus]
MPSTSTGPDLRSGAAWLASAPEDVQRDFLQSLDDGLVLALPHLFEFWALPHQLPPGGDWRTWVILGGRGAGKTRAGAEWVRSLVEGAMPLDPGRCARVAIVGETLDQAREVMVFGDSGILACAPPDRKPVWHGGRRMLTWPNGATAQVFSAHEPEALRGPQFDAAWVDELAKWKRGQEAWDMLQFALRLGENPQVCVTTTPRNVGVLKEVLGRDSTVRTHAPTEANAANLAESFLVEMRARYAGTRLGRQELEGVLMEDAEGALWSRAMLDAARLGECPELDRIVVAVDPPVTGHARSDECGIIVAGVRARGAPQHWQACVLEDASISAASPAAWARAAIAARDRWNAARIVVEVNQGGDMVEAVLRQVDPLVPLGKVRATVNKQARAEPVAALYEQGRVNHLRGFGVLEDQMCAMTTGGYEGTGSPDRLDALVWALSDLMIEPVRKWRHPTVRAL